MAKRFTNAPGDVVPELMQGLALDSSRVSILDPSTGHHVAVRTSITSATAPPRVSVVSGGGSGHEPMAAGYVGEGMLAAAVAGDVFTSPPVAAITSMLDAVAPRSTGILVIVMNYQGDRLNFDMAVKDLLRRSPGYPIQMLLVADDVALPAVPQKRGIAGTIFVLKVAGAAADQGRPLAEVAAIADTAAKSIATFGVALEPCTIPGHAVHPDRLGEDEIELGMGIHGEPGSDKQLLSQLDDSNLTHDLIAEVCTRLDTALQLKHELAPRCQGLAVMVNNLGAVSQSEMLIVCKGVSDFLYNANAPIMNGKVHQVRMYHGTFMTSLQMTGVSISCFMLPADDGFMEQMLHAPTMCCAWNVGFPLHAPEQRLVILRNPADVRRGVAVGASADVYDHAMSRELGGLASVYGPSVAPVGGAVSQSGLARLTEKYILSITAALQKHCDELGSLDRKTGDGDMGDTVYRGCARVRRDLEGGVYAKAAGNPAKLFRLLAISTSDSMGGSSGGLTSIFLNAAAEFFKQRAEYNVHPSWRLGFVAGTDAVMEEGGAVVGDRTLVDALKPAADVLVDSSRSLNEAAHAARIGYEATKSMTTAKFGRSAHVRSGKLLNQADPGALAICIILDALVDAAVSG